MIYQILSKKKTTSKTTLNTMDPTEDPTNHLKLLKIVSGHHETILMMVDYFKKAHQSVSNQSSSRESEFLNKSRVQTMSESRSELSSVDSRTPDLSENALIFKNFKNVGKNKSDKNVWKPMVQLNLVEVALSN
ncbi:uncharacterized protein LOC111692159 [Anoplophora glabripennis]|uniref:uncharacterized protein LOC111692159 n=1 Tax=Anoplophora glabripennis TaxID=217634 RepID=UPI000C771B57|nr:uncharacterized protein LOC111692159 [Anoplophora glabripennis]